MPCSTITKRPHHHKARDLLSKRIGQASRSDRMPTHGLNANTQASKGPLAPSVRAPALASASSVAVVVVRVARWPALSKRQRYSSSSTALMGDVEGDVVAAMTKAKSAWEIQLWSSSSTALDRRERRREGTKREKKKNSQSCIARNSDSSTDLCSMPLSKALVFDAR